MEYEAKELFLIFSQFEYALKNAGYVLSKNKQAKPDWVKFKNQIKNQNITFPDNDTDIKTL